LGRLRHPARGKPAHYMRYTIAMTQFWALGGREILTQS
jgi:hypothetical protein